MSNTFRLQIITPSGKVFDSNATYASMPGDKGEFGVMPSHSALLSLLSPGVIEITKEDGAKESVAINWGYAEVDESSIIVLADGAVAIEGKSTAELQEALNKAEKLLREATSSSSILAAAAQKLRSVTKL